MSMEASTITICPECGRHVKGFADHFRGKHPGIDVPDIAPSPFTEKQIQALRLLATGGARYGTRYEDMTALRDMGLCYAHSKGSHGKCGNWTWRPTDAGRAAIKSLGIVNPITAAISGATP